MTVFLLLAFIAALAMVIQDILGIILLMAATRNRGSLAGVMDTLQWIVGITTTTISVSVLQSHSLWHKAFVVVLISLANYFGTVWGESIGKHFVKDKVLTINDRLEAVEQYIKNDNHS